MKRFLLLLLTVCSALFSEAQIGYQVALLNSATGEPRANVTVSVDVALKGADGSTIYSQTQRATSNDLGLLSLSIGNETMFDDVDWNTVLPLSVSVKADGVLVAESQVLTVPVAEYAKKAGYQVTMDDFIGTWQRDSRDADYGLRTITISENSITFTDKHSDDDIEYETATIEGLWGNALYSRRYDSVYEYFYVHELLYIPSTKSLLLGTSLFHKQ